MPIYIVEFPENVILCKNNHARGFVSIFIIMTKPKIIKKRFSKQLYAESNEVACNAVIKYFNNLGRSLLPYADDKVLFKAPDLIDSEHAFAVEVERKLKFQNEWIWPTVHVEQRKSWLANTICFLAIVNASCDKICIVHPDVLKKYITSRYLMECSNSEIKEGEFFYNIPIAECQLDNIKGTVEDFFNIDDGNTCKTEKIAKFYGFK